MLFGHTLSTSSAWMEEGGGKIQKGKRHSGFRFQALLAKRLCQHAWGLLKTAPSPTPSAELARSREARAAASIQAWLQHSQPTDHAIRLDGSNADASQRPTRNRSAPHSLPEPCRQPSPIPLLIPGLATVSSCCQTAPRTAQNSQQSPAPGQRETQSQHLSWARACLGVCSCCL